MTAAKNIKRKPVVGKRKTSIARVLLSPGEGKILINDREFENYFGREALRFIVYQPFEATGTTGKYNAVVSIFGGGPASQADAVKHALAKCLLEVNPEHRKSLRNAGLLTRDDR